ncbi:MAG: hypothetical protein COW73_09415 [Nitrospirae bacterium CG18_big_fil_WC_8_21_14_2_50_70_55]|nr:chaperone NapD [Deltaproteobacteria bacterium]OIP64985.1 MAG: hypothetical protein AUK30_05580 [Nitrospirae bacterium CG2_30_70_394]PIQ04021.1 MAG: hypothetical protein COW73_09415 [Nitrospirae bacterium CG18_big_fil_WC_8_21_14_2_50_70_55]PIU78038.1 MAG: hypothetical protein COS73_08380 [Nitrospirae bacterium CG06_land_8_20_14_3_00_70_43]PIW82254.1 MAG: hypothetical protein COZ96_09690 [Nitrospirae bacterium CG_4_8_14_3_um_filter_70_85]PIX83841.1 MAG: hypothetical protein COZ33_03310 [Nitro
MDISGLIIDTQEGAMDRVAAAVAALDGVEILRTVEPSRLLALVEADGIDPSMQLTEQIWAIPGVAAINLTCHYHDVEGDDDRRAGGAASLVDRIAPGRR